MRADAVFLVLQETLQTKVDSKSAEATTSFVPFLQNASSSDQQQLPFSSSGQKVELTPAEEAILEDLLQSLQAFLKGEGDFAELLKNIRNALEKADAADLFDRLPLEPDALQTLKENLEAFLKLAAEQKGEESDDNDEKKIVADTSPAEVSHPIPFLFAANTVSEETAVPIDREDQLSTSNLLSPQSIEGEAIRTDEAVENVPAETTSQPDSDQVSKSELPELQGKDRIVAKDVPLADPLKKEMVGSGEEPIAPMIEEEHADLPNTKIKAVSEEGQSVVKAPAKPEVVVQGRIAVKITGTHSDELNTPVRPAEETVAARSLLPAETEENLTETTFAPIPVEVVVQASQKGEENIQAVLPHSTAGKVEMAEPLQFAVASQETGALENLELDLKKGSIQKLSSAKALQTKASVEGKLVALAENVDQLLQQAVKIVQSRASHQSEVVFQNELFKPDSLVFELSSRTTSRTNEKETQPTPMVSPRASVAKGVPLSLEEPLSPLPQPAEVEKAFEQVIQSIQFLKGSNREEARIRLHPPELGEVHIRIGSEKGMLDLQFRAETVQIKQLLEEQMPRLVHALKQSGLSFSSLSVNVGTHTGGESLAAGNHFDDPTFGSVHNIEGEAEEEALAESTSSSLSEVNLLA